MATLCKNCLSLLFQKLRMKITYISQLFYLPDLGLTTNREKQCFQKNAKECLNFGFPGNKTWEMKLGEKFTWQGMIPGNSL